MKPPNPNLFLSVPMFVQKNFFSRHCYYRHLRPMDSALPTPAAHLRIISTAQHIGKLSRNTFDLLMALLCLQSGHVYQFLRAKDLFGATWSRYCWQYWKKFFGPNIGWHDSD